MTNWIICLNFMVYEMDCVCLLFGANTATLYELKTCSICLSGPCLEQSIIYEVNHIVVRFFFNSFKGLALKVQNCNLKNYKIYFLFLYYLLCLNLECLYLNWWNQTSFCESWTLFNISKAEHLISPHHTCYT